MCAVAELVADTLREGHRVVAFGTGHSHLIAEDLFMRAGGLRAVEAVLEPSLMLHEGAAKSSALEKLPGYAAILVGQAGVEAGDVVLVVSSSGRNAVPVEFAEESHRRGCTVVAITSVTHSGAVASCAPSGRRLMEVADLVLDNAVPAGDAAVDLPGRPERVGALSTLTGSALAQAVVAEAATRLCEQGVDPGVLVSYNVDPGTPT
ncbi:MAG: sugar isomerase domain-containing protein [Nocardioidaceae bacterium]